MVKRLTSGCVSQPGFIKRVITLLDFKDYLCRKEPFLKINAVIGLL